MGRIVTVSDGAGRSVTVSNWGGGTNVKAPLVVRVDIGTGIKVVLQYKLKLLTSNIFLLYFLTFQMG